MWSFPFILNFILTVAVLVILIKLLKIQKYSYFNQTFGCNVIEFLILNDAFCTFSNLASINVINSIFYCTVYLHAPCDSHNEWSKKNNSIAKISHSIFLVYTGCVFIEIRNEFLYKILMNVCHRVEGRVRCSKPKAYLSVVLRPF
jgi:hypothetical protein